MSVIAHLDEATPHVHVVVVPLMPKDGGGCRLSARDFVGNRGDLRALQDSFAEAVAHLGLHRRLDSARRRYFSLNTFREMTVSFVKRLRVIRKKEARLTAWAEELEEEQALRSSPSVPRPA